MQAVMGNKRLIGAVLTLLATVMLLFGWIGISDKDTRDYLKEVVSDAVDGLDETLEGFDQYPWLLGGSIKKSDIRHIRNALKTLKDGRLAPSELGALASGVGSVQKIGDGLAPGFMEDMKGVGWLRFGVALFWLALLCGLASAYLRFRGNGKAVGLAFSALMLFLFVMVIILAAKLDEDISFGLTAWPFLAMLCTAGAMATDFLHGPAAAAATVPTAAVGKAGDDGWMCPACGRMQAASAAFCTGCGAPRPQKMFCTSCGAKLQPGTAFCTSCGAPQGPAAAPADGGTPPAEG